MMRIASIFIVVLLLLTLLPQQAHSYIVKSENKNTPSKGPMNSPWSMYRRDMRHTGRSPYGKAGCTGVLKWKVKIGWLISSSPAIDKEGTIYIGSDNCKLYAIYPNGTIKWTLALGDFVDSSPALAEDGTIYVGCDDGYLYAVNPDGTIKWKKRVGEGSYIFSSPLIDENGIIYIGTTGIKGKGTFAAFYPDGTVKWEASIKTASPPAKYRDTIYVPGNDGYLYAVCAENGTVKWKYKVGCYSRTTGVSIGDDGTIYFSSFDYKCLYAFYPNGTLRWKKKITYSYISPAIGEDGTLYVATASGWGDDYVYAFSPNGTMLWKCKTVPSGSSGLAIDRYGVIYGGGSLRAIYAVNPNGTMRWFYKINNEDGVIASCPAIGEDGTIYIAAWDGYLYAIEPRDAADLRVSGIYYGPTFGCIKIRVKNVGCEPAYNVTCSATIYTPARKENVDRKSVV